MSVSCTEAEGSPVLTVLGWLFVSGGTHFVGSTHGRSVCHDDFTLQIVLFCCAAAPSSPGLEFLETIKARRRVIGIEDDGVPQGGTVGTRSCFTDKRDQSRWPDQGPSQGHGDAPNWRSSSSRQATTYERLLHARQLLCLLLMEHGWGGDWASHRLAQDFDVNLHAYDGAKVVGACPTDAIVPLWYRYRRNLGTALCRNLVRAVLNTALSADSAQAWQS